MDNQKHSGSKKLFSVPIYFRSKEEHRKYFEKKWQKYLEQRIDNHRNLSLTITEKDKVKWESEFKHSYFHFWKYTEIIGYIEFRIKEKAIYAFIILAVSDKFAPIINKKTFRIYDEFPPVKISIREMLNEHIVKEIYETLEKINYLNDSFKKYYIDTSEIKTYLHLIDFHKL